MVAYERWSLTRAKTQMGQNVSSLEFGTYRDLCVNVNAVLSKGQLKVNFEKKIRLIPVSCTRKGYDKIAPYYPFFAPLSVKWTLTGG